MSILRFLKHPIRTRESQSADVYFLGLCRCRSCTMKKWDNIYCACYQSIMDKITGNIYGHGLQSLYQSTIPMLLEMFVVYHIIVVTAPLSEI